MKKKQAKQVQSTIEYVAAKGSSITNADAEIIGEELRKIAEANQVDSIRSLDAETVFEAVQSDPHHPMRAFYEWDESKAALAHWIEHTGKLIRSVRVVTITLGERSRPAPMFFYDPHHARRTTGDSAASRRSRVIAEDALMHDPVFASVVSGQIRIIVNALDRLEHIVESRGTKASAHVTGLCAALRDGVTDYLASLEHDDLAAAAE